MPEPQAQAQTPQDKALALQAQAQVFWAAQAQAQADLRWTDTEHCFHRVGNTVKITRVHDQKFKAFVNFEGVIRRTVARGPNFKFFVQIQRNAAGEAVDRDKEIADLNRRCFGFLPKDQRGLMACKNTHIRHVRHVYQCPPQDDQGGAKRPRLGGSDGATSA